MIDSIEVGLSNTREEAARKRAVRYFTGVACKKGHMDERYTSNGMCLSCVNPKRALTEFNDHTVKFHDGANTDTIRFFMRETLPKWMPVLWLEAQNELTRLRAEAGARVDEHNRRVTMLLRAGNAEVYLTPLTAAHSSHDYCAGKVDGKRWGPWELVDAGLFAWKEMEYATPVTD